MWVVWEHSPMTAGKLEPFWTAVGVRGIAVMVSKEHVSCTAWPAQPVAIPTS